MSGTEAHVETQHMRNAKQPYKNTNRRNVEPQIARRVARRDTLELLADVYEEEVCTAEVQLAARIFTEEEEGEGEQEDDDSLNPAPKSNALMGVKKQVIKLRLSDQVPPVGGRPATAAHPCLESLWYAVRLYVHQAQDGDPEDRISDMPELDVDEVRIFCGLRLAASTERRVMLGGYVVRGSIMHYSLDDLPIVAVQESGGPLWYGRMILTLTFIYQGTPRAVVYVRWLHTTAAVAAAKGRRETADEVLGPYDNYRYALHPGSLRGRRFFPRRHGPHYGCASLECVKYVAPMCATLHTYSSEDPLFRLVHHMWDI